MYHPVYVERKVIIDTPDAVTTNHTKFDKIQTDREMNPRKGLTYSTVYSVKSK